MATFLAIDWEQQKICGVEGEVSRDVADLKRCFALTWPEEMDPAEDPQAAGEHLRAALREAGVTSKQVLVTFPREAAVVRHLEVPQVEDSELPDVVRFQAASKSSLPLDQLCLDFLPLPPRVDSVGRDVLMATLSAERLRTVRSVLEAAGLELVAASLSSVATAELVARIEEPDLHGEDAASLIVARHGNRVEISVIRKHRLIFTHSTQVSSPEPDREIVPILAEVTRTSVALQKLAPGTRIAHAWAVGQSASYPELIEGLRSRLNCEVTAVDPLSNASVSLKVEMPEGDRTLYAGPVGILLSRAGRTIEPLDFVTPRKAVVKKSLYDYRFHAVGAGVAVLLLGAFIWSWWLTWSLNANIEKARDDTNKLEDALKVKAEKGGVLDQFEDFDEWRQTDRQWIAEVETVVKTMGGTEWYYLESFNVGPGPGKAVGRVHLAGHAKSRRVVEDLQRKLDEHETFEIRAYPTTNEREDSEYPYEFVLDVDIVKKEPESQQPGGRPRTASRSRGGRL